VRCEFVVVANRHVPPRSVQSTKRFVHAVKLSLHITQPPAASTGAAGFFYGGSPLDTYSRKSEKQVHAAEERLILDALQILRARFRERDVFSSPDAVKDFLRLQAQGLDHEIFAVMYLDPHNRLIDYEQCAAPWISNTTIQSPGVES
jgi:hypothetical protein